MPESSLPKPGGGRLAKYAAGKVAEKAAAVVIVVLVAGAAVVGTAVALGRVWGAMTTEGHPGDGGLLERHVMAAVVSRPLAERIALVEAGATLMKYNQRDGKSGARWVRVSPDHAKIHWGDATKKSSTSSLPLKDAIAVMHGAKSSAFFKQQGAKKDHDYFCFSVVFEKRSLDFAATSAQALVDWYLSLIHI